jgi:hypothetical protein
MDLTKIDQPFGTLGIETKLALCRAFFEGKVIERVSHGDSKWFVTNSPNWVPDHIYRLQPEPLRDISLPWAAVDARWQWAARDKSGLVCVYSECPDLGGSVWTTESSYLEVTDLFAVFGPGNKPWNESLIRRPEGL